MTVEDQLRRLFKAASSKCQYVELCDVSYRLGRAGFEWHAYVSPSYEASRHLKATTPEALIDAIEQFTGNDVLLQKARELRAKASALEAEATQGAAR